MIEYEAWIAHLRQLAEPVIDDAWMPRGTIERIIEYVHMRRADPSILRPKLTSEGFDESLWLRHVGLDINADELLEDSGRNGPLFPQESCETIEVWTERELSALHVLWWLAYQNKHAGWQRLIERVRGWHMENTQPDNATNRPWALHVFLMSNDIYGKLYAETLLHNSLAVNGKPDQLCARILLDAASALETFATISET